MSGSAANPGRPWYLYILHCRGGSLYTGITTDVTRRYAAHVAGKGARYTRSFPPERIALVVMFDSKGEALAAEHAVKAMSRTQKHAWLAAQTDSAGKSSRAGSCKNAGKASAGANR